MYHGYAVKCSLLDREDVFVLKERYSSFIKLKELVSVITVTLFDFYVTQNKNEEMKNFPESVYFDQIRYFLSVGCDD